MNRVFEYVAEESGITIYEFLKSRGFSRKVMVHLKKSTDSITVDGEWKPFRYCLQKGQHLQVFYKETHSSPHILPVELPITIMYEDEDLLVIDKPADMPVHPSQGNYENTLANALAFYYRGQNFTFRCINRLDRDTTGLLVVAKNAVSAGILSDMMKKRQIYRTYYAIVKGKIPPQGEIDAPIARADGSTVQRKVDFVRGEHAVTHFKRLFYEDGYSMASICLETGRTHQIRVHMNYIGHPLPGDFLYCPDYSIFYRQPLHAQKLSFLHPITRKMLTFTAKFPEDFGFVRISSLRNGIVVL